MHVTGWTWGFWLKSLPRHCWGPTRVKLPPTASKSSKCRREQGSTRSTMLNLRGGPPLKWWPTQFLNCFDPKFADGMSVQDRLDRRSRGQTWRKIGLPRLNRKVKLLQLRWQCWNYKSLVRESDSMSRSCEDCCNSLSFAAKFRSKFCGQQQKQGVSQSRSLVSAIYGFFFKLGHACEES